MNGLYVVSITTSNNVLVVNRIGMDSIEYNSLNGRELNLVEKVGIWLQNGKDLVMGSDVTDEIDENGVSYALDEIGYNGSYVLFFYWCNYIAFIGCGCRLLYSSMQIEVFGWS